MPKKTYCEFCMLFPARRRGKCVLGFKLYWDTSEKFRHMVSDECGLESINWIDKKGNGMVYEPDFSVHESEVRS